MTAGNGPGTSLARPPLRYSASISLFGTPWRRSGYHRTPPTASSGSGLPAAPTPRRRRTGVFHRYDFSAGRQVRLEGGRAAKGQVLFLARSAWSPLDSGPSQTTWTAAGSYVSALIKMARQPTTCWPLARSRARSRHACSPRRGTSTLRRATTPHSPTGGC